jgi:hypothetical protein
MNGEVNATSGDVAFSIKCFAMTKAGAPNDKNSLAVDAIDDTST